MDIPERLPEGITEKLPDSQYLPLAGLAVILAILFLLAFLGTTGSPPPGQTPPGHTPQTTTAEPVNKSQTPINWTLPDASNESLIKNASRAGTLGEFLFAEGTRYTYRTYTQRDGHGYLHLRIQDFSPNGHALTHVSYSRNDTLYTTSLSGPATTIRAQAKNDSAIQSVLPVLLKLPFSQPYPEDVSVGDSWTRQGMNQTEFVYEAVSHGKRGDVPCYQTIIKQDDQMVGKFCYSPSKDFMPYVELYDETGDVTVRIRLQEYQRGY